MTARIPLRTALNWLQAHDLSDDAEVWVLADNRVEPVVHAAPWMEGNYGVWTDPVWTEPVPVPLRFRPFLDRVMETYTAGGTFTWESGYTYRGSYVVNPDNAVFLIFLPNSTQLVETHGEVMEKRRQQAKQLTREIENAWDSSM